MPTTHNQLTIGTKLTSSKRQKHISRIFILLLILSATFVASGSTEPVKNYLFPWLNNASSATTFRSKELTGLALNHYKSDGVQNIHPAGLTTEQVMNEKESAPTLACSLTQQITKTGCYYTGGMSKATVSVEVGWSGAVNGDTITVSVGTQTRTIKPESFYDPGSGSPVAGPIVTPQVVAFEIDADGTTTYTVTSTLSGSSSCTVVEPSFTAPSSCTPNLCDPGELGGTIFLDFNGNGKRESGEVLGSAGVVIKAYDSNNTVVGTATSDSEGRYEFSAINGNVIATTSYPLRLEFTNLPTSGLQTTTLMGINNGSSVQFVSAAQCGVDVGVLDQSGYCQDNPLMVLPCYVNGDPLPAGSSGDEDALIAFPYNSSVGPGPVTHLATARQVGSLWGVAYNKYTNKAFSSAVLKRHVGLGPLGLGGIYVIDMNSYTTSNFIDVTDVTTLNIDLGQAMLPAGGNGVGGRELMAVKTQANHDATVFPLIGKIGIGDLDISEDGNKLFFVNLHDKSLYSIDITAYNSSGSKPTVADKTATPIPDPKCKFGESRPFGTKVYRGKVYVGTICDGSMPSSVMTLDNQRSNLKASIFVYDTLAMSFDPIPVLTFPLTYPKGYPASVLTKYTGWYAWTDVFNDLLPLSPPAACPDCFSYPTPILADIEFDTDGTMVIGFADRTALQTGYRNYSDTPTDMSLYRNLVGGDVLRAFFSNNSFVLENNAKAGPNVGFKQNNNQGPGFGEFYNDNYNNSAFPPHTEEFQGGLAIKPGSGEVIAVTMDPVPSKSNAAGVRTLSNSNGDMTNSFMVYENSFNNTDGRFGKAASLGDVELTCGTVDFLEIGNRVWADTNANGIQDPNELPVKGATVHLYTPNGPDGIAGNTDDKTPVATAVTDANGNYRFTSILPNTRYVIRLDQAADYQSGGALDGKTITQANADSGAFGNPGDLHDSDAVTGNVLNIPGGNFAEIEVQHLVSGVATNGTGDFGQVDHTFDFGLNSGVKCDTICFRSPQYWLLNLNKLPKGTVLIAGTNGNQPVSTSNVTAIGLALKGNALGFGTLTPQQQFNQEFVAAQLNFLSAGGSGSPVTYNSMWANLSCYGIKFNPVTLSNGVTLTVDSMVKELWMQATLVAHGNNQADFAALAAIFDLLNGNSPSGLCN